MKTIERIYKYIEYKNITPSLFEKKTGISNGYLGKQYRRKADIGETIAMRIIENCPDVDPLWLLTGKGEMLKSGETTPSSHINNDAIPPMEEAKPAPTQASNSELMLEKICQLSADNALLRHENEELKSENGVLKHEIEDLKNNRPLPASIPYDLARSSAPSLASEPDIEVYQGRYGNDKNNLKHL